MLTNLLLCEKHVHFGGFFTTFRDFFHLYINVRVFLEEIGDMLIGKTYVNERFMLMGVTLIRSFQYKGKEGGGKGTSEKATLMRGLH